MVGGMKRAKSSTHTFSGRVADRGWIVDDQGLVLDALEQMRRRDVAEVERRVLAHQHDIDIAAEVQDREVAQPEMIARHRLHADFMRAGVEPAFLIGQVVGQIMVERISARLRAEHDGERGIAGDVDALQRVHLHCDAKRHGASA